MIKISFLQALLLSAVSVGDVAGPIIALDPLPGPDGTGPDGPPPEGALETPPGCVAPEGATTAGREQFPALVACGGVFRGTPAADGTVHFDMGLLPTRKDEAGKDLGLMDWPTSKDEAGAVIPFPWAGHNRNKFLALTRDCFDSEASYYYYRMYEAYGKAQTAYQEFVDSRDGKAKEDVKKAKSQQRLISDLEALRSELGNVDGLEAVLEAIRKNALAKATAAGTAA